MPLYRPGSPVNDQILTNPELITTPSIMCVQYTGRCSVHWGHFSTSVDTTSKVSCNVSVSPECYHPPHPPHTHPTPPATPGHLTKNHAQRTGFCPHKLCWGPVFDRGWEVAKFDIRGLFLPKIAFSLSIQSMKQHLLSGLRTVKYAVMFCN